LHEFRRVAVRNALGTVELETTDKMTDRQRAAKVSEQFTKAPASKSAAPKKTAKAMSGKRTKKGGK
jgi:hypothetical protein